LVARGGAPIPHARIVRVAPSILSVVVPVYQGAKHLPDLMAALAAARRELETSSPLRLAEAFFVDDAAIDASDAVLDRLRAENEWATVIHLSRNFGQHPATIAGVLHCSGDWVATLDEDLQHDPRHLPALLRQAVREGLDVVYAKPVGSVHRSWLRDRSSLGFKALMSRLTRNPHVRDFNSFRLMRGSIARAAAAVCAHDPYYDVALSWFTDRVGTLPIDMTDRRYVVEKRSGYSMGSLFRHAGRMLASSNLRLLRLGSFIGILALLFSVLMSLAVVAIKIFDPAAVQARGWVSLVILISFFGGLSSLLAGILVELTSSLVARARGKPTFFVVDRSRDADLLAWARGTIP
jgi:polyisoprenyl-phosphate glycosyltransferase